MKIAKIKTRENKSSRKLNTHIENSNQLGFCPSEFIFRNIRLHLSNLASELSKHDRAEKTRLKFILEVTFSLPVSSRYGTVHVSRNDLLCQPKFAHQE